MMVGHSLRLLVIVVVILSSWFAIRLLSNVGDSSLLTESMLFQAPTAPLAPSSTSVTNQESRSSSTTSTRIPICFVTCLFGKWASQVDRIQNVTKLDFYDDSSVSFFLFTNLPRVAPDTGWTKLLQTDLPYQRFITQSRWPKFMAWQGEGDPYYHNNNTVLPEESCTVVFYLDSLGELIGTLDGYQQQARDILESDIELAQYLHRGGGGARQEFRRIEVFHKDAIEHIEASKAWLHAQGDYNENCTLYENRYLAYAYHSTAFRQAATFFWDHYSQEVDSWRDQPLWCYVLDHFHLTPLPLRHKELFTQKIGRMNKHQKHRYGTDADTDALQARREKEEKQRLQSVDT